MRNRPVCGRSCTEESRIEYAILSLDSNHDLGDLVTMAMSLAADLDAFSHRRPVAGDSLSGSGLPFYRLNTDDNTGPRHRFRIQLCDPQTTLAGLEE